MDKIDFLEHFLNIPVAINNLYGDPFLQKENTYQKLTNLVNSNHKGIVAIITKSEITEEDALKLSEFSKKLKLVILVSVSELQNVIEHTIGDRYKTLFLCNKYNIPALAYIRPFIPMLNTQEDVISKMFEKINDANIKNVIISGLRGNDYIFSKVGISDEEKRDWSYRVKIVPQEVRKVLNKYCGDFNIFERTSCGVAYVLGEKFSHNPYFSSPQLAKCYKCPLKSSCFDKRKDFIPTEEDVEFLKILGYFPKHVFINKDELCTVNPLKRTECESCCTGCFKLERDSIEISPSFNVNLGDIGLCRHLLGGKLVHHLHTIDDGASNVGQPLNPLFKDVPIYILNSWWSYSRNMSYCYNCHYCIVPVFKNQNKEYGSLPLDAGKIIWERVKNV